MKISSHSPSLTRNAPPGVNRFAGVRLLQGADFPRIKPPEQNFQGVFLLRSLERWLDNLLFPITEAFQIQEQRQRVDAYARKTLPPNTPVGIYKASPEQWLLVDGDDTRKMQDEISADFDQVSAQYAPGVLGVLIFRSRLARYEKMIDQSHQAVVDRWASKAQVVQVDA